MGTQRSGGSAWDALLEVARGPMTSQSSVLPADPFCAWEGTLRCKECLGPGSGHSGSLNAKQSLGEIDGGGVLSGEARGLPQFHCGYLWPCWGVRDWADSSL